MAQRGLYSYFQVASVIPVYEYYEKARTFKFRVFNRDGHYHSS